MTQLSVEIAAFAASLWSSRKRARLHRLAAEVRMLERDAARMEEALDEHVRNARGTDDVVASVVDLRRLSPPLGVIRGGRA
jgi:hypothetical protein